MATQTHHLILQRETAWGKENFVEINNRSSSSPSSSTGRGSVLLGRPCPLGLFPHYELRTDLAGWVVPSKLGLQRWITAAAAVASLDRPQSHPRRRNPSPDAGNCSLGDAHQRPPSRHQRQLLGGREEGGPQLIIPMYFNCICGRTFKGRCDHHGVKKYRRASTPFKVREACRVLVLPTTRQPGAQGAPRRARGVER